jgi:pyruvate,orthophosphate dikinase
MTSNKKYVYFFGNGEAEGQNDQRDVLGGKGMNLAEMTRVGVPVPPGFTISTLVCKYYNDHVEQGMSGDELLPAGIWKEVEEHLKRLEQATGKGFGDPHNPLLVSVRSGAAVSMPGMMDTILNLGLTRRRCRGSPRRRRMLASPGTATGASCRCSATSCSRSRWRSSNRSFEAAMKSAGVERDADLSAEALEKLVGDFKKTVLEETGNPFPDRADRAAARTRSRRSTSPGATRAPRSPTAASTRSRPARHGGQRPDDGLRQHGRGLGHGRLLHARPLDRREQVFFGEFLMNAQGEDVVAGIRTPEPSRAREPSARGSAQLFDSMAMLEKHYKRNAGHRVHYRAWCSCSCCRPARASARRTRRCKIAVDMVRKA